MKLLGKKLSTFNFQLLTSKGFTLIELLIVIAILGILAAGILVAVDPIDKISQANDSKVQNDVSGAGRASEAYATVNNGFYPDNLAKLVAAGELKRVPVPPTGYVPATYGFVTVPASCTAGVDCTSVVITGTLKSKKFTSVGNSVWRYESSTGKSCARANTTDACL